MYFAWEHFVWGKLPNCESCLRSKCIILEQFIINLGTVQQIDVQRQVEWSSEAYIAGTKQKGASVQTLAAGIIAIAKRCIAYIADRDRGTRLSTEVCSNEVRPRVFAAAARTSASSCTGEVHILCHCACVFKCEFKCVSYCFAKLLNRRKRLCIKSHYPHHLIGGAPVEHPLQSDRIY